MKCPLCGSKMSESIMPTEKFYYCLNHKCRGADGIYIGLIRAIRRKLKAEYERGRFHNARL